MTADERAALAKAVCDAMHEADPFYVSYDHAIAAIDLIRDETLEEAAGVFDEMWGGITPDDADAAIRALKGDSTDV